MGISSRTTPCTSLRMDEFPWLESPLAMLVTWRKPCTTSPSNSFLAPVESRSSPHTAPTLCSNFYKVYQISPLLSRSKDILCLSKSDETPGDFNAMTFLLCFYTAKCVLYELSKYATVSIVIRGHWVI